MFDNNKSLITECTLKDNQLDSISSYEYESNHCNFAIKTNRNDEKIILDESSTMNGVKSYQVAPINAYTSDYILYGFVEADSYQKIRKRRNTAYCEHTENDNSTILFELRCLLQYKRNIMFLLIQI